MTVDRTRFPSDQYSRATEEAIRRLSRAFPRLDEQQLHDAVTDAATGMHEQGDFCGLYRAAWRNARDIAQSECSRKEREHRWAQEHLGANVALSQEPSAETAHRADALVDMIADVLPCPRMKITFRLRLAGERSCARYADALGAGNCSREEQRMIVHREKDRLLKYLQRNANARQLLDALCDQGRSKG